MLTQHALIPHFFYTPDCVISSKENSKRMTIIEEDGKQYLEKEVTDMEGWKNRTKN